MNWDRPADVGRLEYRYVRRGPDYFVVYLSSQTGCAPGLPHVPPDGDRPDALRDATLGRLVGQAKTVLDHYRREAQPARTVTSTSWPAAGRWPARRCWPTPTELLGEFVAAGHRGPAAAARSRPSCRGRFGGRPLENVFVTHHPDIYYSIYSMTSGSAAGCRRRRPREGLDRLASWQRALQGRLRCTTPTSPARTTPGDVHALCDALGGRGLMVHVNIVRHNPFDPARHGVGPPEEVIQRSAAVYRARLPNARVSVIARVGFDVAASCGMFFGPEARM
ncbi:MAG: hypothetical protein U0797_24095 [Gemmataceae bacterium]